MSGRRIVLASLLLPLLAACGKSDPVASGREKCEEFVERVRRIEAGEEQIELQPDPSEEVLTDDDRRIVAATLEFARSLDEHELDAVATFATGPEATDLRLLFARVLVEHDRIPSAWRGTPTSRGGTTSMR